MAKKNRPVHPSKSWNGVADWYAGWSGAKGSIHHRKVAIPAVMHLLEVKKAQHILDIGCGPGALARHVTHKEAFYTGIDLSPKLLRLAEAKNGSGTARFLMADATKLPVSNVIKAGSFDAAVFLLSLQDINPLEEAIQSAAWALKPGGIIVLLLTHPCFRVPRQSGWGFDERRKLCFRRVDRYLAALDVPMQPYEKGKGITRSFHRPLTDYVMALSKAGFRIDALLEPPPLLGGDPKASNPDLPTFMAIRGIMRPD